MSEKKSLGEFEQLVLLACLRLADQATAPAVVEEIRDRTRREPSHAAVYIALRRLEEHGLVESRLGTPTPERGGRAKRHFRVLPDAVELLKAGREALLSMWEGLETS